jgi:hypothetical protein
MAKQPKPTAKSEDVATPVTTQKKTKTKGQVPDYTKKVRSIPARGTFKAFFEHFIAKQKALGFHLFTGELGKYAVQVAEKKMVVRSFKNEKGIQLECLETDFGFYTQVFLSEKLVKTFSTENFTANFKLPNDVQEEQKALHTFLRTAYEQTDEFKADLVTDTYKLKPVLTLVPKTPQNSFAGFAREENTCSDIRALVMGRVKVYRIADKNGKYAVLSLTSQGEVAKVVRITLKFLQEGHELEGGLPLETMVELHKLKREYLGKPHGPFEQQQKNQGVLHAWLRKVAMEAGIKDKPAKKLAKAA